MAQSESCVIRLSQGGQGQGGTLLPVFCFPPAGRVALASAPAFPGRVGMCRECEPPTEPPRVAAWDLGSPSTEASGRPGAGGLSSWSWEEGL